MFSLFNTEVADRYFAKKKKTEKDQPTKSNVFDFQTPWHSTRFAQDCLFRHCMVIEPVDETSTSDLLWSPWAGGHAWRNAHVFVDDARVGEDRGPNIIRTAGRSIWRNMMSESEAFKIKREIKIRVQSRNSSSQLG